MTEIVPVRAAASKILWRKSPVGPEVLMGLRGAAAVFMPSKFVFPGGAVDPEDHSAGHLSDLCRSRLSQQCPERSPSPEEFVGCALREMLEETGIALPPTAPLYFLFRAITPAGSPRRFDARFFLADAENLLVDGDDFSGATGELSNLHWIGLRLARDLDLPFITKIVLAEVAALLDGQHQPGVPFFDNSGPVPNFRRLI